MNNNWINVNNAAYDCEWAGMRYWQNDNSPHLVDGFTGAGNKRCDLEHGAYRNAVTFQKLKLNSELGMILHALPITNATPDQRGYVLKFLDSYLGNVKVLKHVLASHIPVLFLNCEIDEFEIDHTDGVNPGLYDFVNCGFESGINLTRAVQGTVIRQQDMLFATSMDSTGDFEEIEPFYNF
jgi:hypothetical protein